MAPSHTTGEKHPVEKEDSNSAGSSSFLFVNETGAPAIYKKGNRQDIKSHVRKQNAKRFRESHKVSLKGKEEKILPRQPSPVQNTCQCHISSKSLTIARSPASNSTSPLPDAASRSPSGGFLPAQKPVAEIPKPTVSYCKVCGKPLDHDQQLSQRSPARTSLKIYSGERSRRLDPVSVLGSGRVDPFSSYPTGKPNHELIDLVITYMIPGLLPDDVKQVGQLNSVSQAWFGSSLKTPVLFHALIFVAKIHQDYARLSLILPNSPELLSYKLSTIRALRKLMKEGDVAARTSDEAILASLILASHEILPVGEGEHRNPFNAPLKNMNWENIYGNTQYVPEHMKAVSELIAFRGGIEKLKLPGLAEAIFAGDMISATNSVSKPTLPLTPLQKRYITKVRTWASTASPAHRLGTGFAALQTHGVTSSMQHVFTTIAATTIAIQHYVQGKPNSFSEGAIARTRLAVQHSLLLLPPQDEIRVSLAAMCEERTPCVYESCRLTALIYGAVITASVPNTYDLYQTLTQRLRLALQDADAVFGLAEEWEFGGGQHVRDVQNVVLWVLVVGGIAALGNEERPWFVGRLGRMVKMLGLEDWESVEEIMGSFLWLESACAPGGRELWDEVQAYQEGEIPQSGKENVKPVMCFIST